MEKNKSAKEIKRKGLELGFSKVGITTANDFTEYEEEIRSRPDYDEGAEKGAFRNCKCSFLS